MKKKMMLLTLLAGCTIFISVAINAGSRKHKHAVDSRYAIELKRYDSIWVKAFSEGEDSFVSTSEGLAGR